MTDTNPNTTYTAAFIHGLASNGLRTVIISPGSRSTPLTLAFDAHPDIKLYIHQDERGAAFFALGIALATDTPVALVCSSGTAIANYHPAIIEARQSHVPLIVLTADRPHELRHSGANQTIDQIKPFGDHVLLSADMPIPESNLVPSQDGRENSKQLRATEAAPQNHNVRVLDIALRNATSMAARAIATANGLTKGPVHLNFPFRKPFEPTGKITFPNKPAPQIQRGTLTPTAQQTKQLTNLLSNAQSTAIILGPRTPENAIPAILSLAEKLQIPIFADPLSNARYMKVSSGKWKVESEHPSSSPIPHPLIISTYETFLAPPTPHSPLPTPQVVLRFGALPTSKWLNQYLTSPTIKHQIQIRENGVWADDNHTLTQLLQVNERQLCMAIIDAISPRFASNWAQTIQKIETETRATLSEKLTAATFDAAYIHDLINHLPNHSNLIIGNSLPIRHIDQFGLPNGKQIRTFGNRGASGIDGTIATALGVASTTNQPSYLLIGDITFYHDINSLLLAQQLPNPLTIILMNNNGGAIFRRLPIAQHNPPFEKLFLTPHQLNFAPIAQGFGWQHTHIQNRTHFAQTLAQPTTTPTILEIQTDSAHDAQQRKQLLM